MDRPPPDPRALLSTWMEWERGESTPGRVLASLKTAGMRELLDNLVAAQEEAARSAAITGSGGAGAG
ncbi:MAG TPA: hypothetical protein VGB14_19405 [Acidimicrobiales bacterium]|jgi:hypothetical protein